MTDSYIVTGNCQHTIETIHTATHFIPHQLQVSWSTSAFSASTLLVWRQEEHSDCKNLSR